MEVAVAAVHLVVDRHAQAEVGVAADERLAQIAGGHDRSQIQIPHEAGDLVDERPLRVVALDVLTSVQPSQGDAVGEGGATLLGHPVDALLDLDLHGSVVGTRGRISVQPHAHLAAELQALDLLPVEP